MLRRWLAAALMATALNGATLAQDDDVMVHYDAYNAALSEGRVDDAIVAGEAAWRAAEASWGDSADTAVLAYNIAALMVRRGRSGEALEPAQRALILAESGVAPDVASLEAAIVLGLAEAEQDRPRPGIEHLYTALEAHAAAAAEGDDIVALAWLKLASDAHQRRQWRKAQQHGNRARSVAEGIGPELSHLVRQAAWIEGSAAAFRRKNEDALIAVSAGLAATSGDVSALNDQWFARLAASRAWLSSSPSGFVEHAIHVEGIRVSRRRAVELERDGDQLEFSEPLGSECGAWGERRPPFFPVRAAEQAKAGALIVAFDLTPDGAVTNLRLLGSAPAVDGGLFRDNVVLAMSTWRMELADGADDNCVRDQVVEFVFSLAS